MKLLVRKARAKWLAVLIVMILLVVGIWWAASDRTPSPPATNTTNSTSGGHGLTPTESDDLEACLLQASNSDANSAVIEQARRHCYDTYR